MTAKRKYSTTCNTLWLFNEPSRDVFKHNTLEHVEHVEMYTVDNEGFVIKDL